MLLQLDILLFRWINSHWTHAFLDGLFVAFQNPWWMWPPLALLSIWLWVKGGKHGRVFLVALIVSVAFTDILCAQVLKPLIARVRPCEALPGVRALVGIKTSWSMPSNHAANVTAAACAVGMFYRRWLIPAALVAFLVAYSRIYVGVHYPLDVFQGAVVGAAIGSLTAATARDFESKWLSGRIKK